MIGFTFYGEIGGKETYTERKETKGKT